MTERVIHEPSAFERDVYEQIIISGNLRRERMITEPVYWAMVDSLLDQLNDYNAGRPHEKAIEVWE